MVKSKIHRATVTGLALHYEGSIAIDEDLMRQADVLPGEQVQVLNLNNGERFITYAITAPPGSGTMEVNGPAARLCAAGDLIIVVTYCQMPDEEARTWQPTLIMVDERNRALPSA